MHWFSGPGEPVIAANIAAEPRLKGETQVEGGFKSCAFLPLKVANQSRGVIYLASFRMGHFNEKKREHLLAIARQMGVTMENRELFEETERRAREQEALNAVASATSQSLRRDELLEIALDKVLEVTGRERVTIRVRNPVTGAVTLAAHKGFLPEEVEDLLRRASHQAIDQVFASGQPLVINDGSEGYTSLTLLTQSRSVAWIPLKAGVSVVGILGISASRPIPFSQREVDFLQCVANVIGVALENVRFYENERNQVKSLRLLVDASRKLVEQVDTEALAQDILETVVTSFGVRLAWIGSAEADGRVQPLYWAGDVAEYLRRVEIRWDDSPLGYGPAGRAIRTGRPVVMDVATDSGFVPWREPALAHGYREVAAFPLMRGAKPFGHLILYSAETGFFTPERVELLQTYANIAAAALENARLFEETKRRAQEQAALNSIATAVSQSLEVGEILKIGIDKVLEVTGREQGYIRLVDPVTGNLTLAVHRGISEKYVQTLLHQRTPGGKSDQVFASGEPLIVNDPEGSLLKEQTRHEGSRSMGWFPLKVRGRVVGIMNVSTLRSIAFKSREVEMLKAIGNIIGVALENARLFSETQARYWEVQTLQAISDTILDSLDLQIVMERILEKTFEIGGFDIGVIRLIDAKSGTVKPLAFRGYRNPQNVDGHRKNFAGHTGGPGGLRLMHETTVHVLDLTQGDSMRTFKKEGVCTLLTVPLRSDTEVLGAIQLGSRTRRQFEENELRLLDAIGHQAGIAIQKARLYEESRQAQAALAEKAEELGRSNKELQHFAYVASHDLQEPLRMVASYVQLLARRYQGRIDDDANEYIAFAVDGATRMQALINALLSYSRIGTKARSLEPTDCEEVLQSALKNLQLAIEDSKAVVTHASLPTVLGDPTQLTQLFQNLIGNAIKFRGAKPPLVHVSAERNRKEWLFSCRDDGIGIDPEYFERIFVIFQRLHSKEEYTGTGIGLALCKKIVERHGGRIWVESDPGRGSNFRFTIPL